MINLLDNLLTQCALRPALTIPSAAAYLLLNNQMIIHGGCKAISSVVITLKLSRKINKTDLLCCLFIQVSRRVRLVV